MDADGEIADEVSDVPQPSPANSMSEGTITFANFWQDIFDHFDRQLPM